MAEKGHDHRGAGHDQDGAEEQGLLEIDSEDEMGGGCGQGPGDERAQRHQAGHHATYLPQLLESEARSSLEQDDGDGDRDDREQQVPEHGIRIQEPGERAGHQAEQKENQDGWQAHAPGDPLGGDPECDDRGDGDEEVLAHQELSESAGPVRRVDPVPYAVARHGVNALGFLPSKKVGKWESCRG